MNLKDTINWYKTFFNQLKVVLGLKYTIIIVLALFFAGYIIAKNTDKAIMRYAYPIVTKVYDGDTVTLHDKTKVRLYGIDAPEMSQKYGDVARDQLRNKILNRYVDIEIKGKDKYGRVVAVIYLDGMDINKWMLENGHAFLYEEYNDNEDYVIASEKAKRKKLGVYKHKIQNPKTHRELKNKK